jgi:hypothetical protein
MVAYNVRLGDVPSVKIEKFPESNRCSVVTRGGIEYRNITIIENELIILNKKYFP